MLSLKIAIRYLLSKKSHNAINGITLVASCGVAIITAAIICMLSVFNGFESLIDSLCSNFDAELRIEPRRGKSFLDTDSLRNVILNTDGVEILSAVLEENILLSYGNHQIPAKMMGVDDAFAEVTQIQDIVAAGEYILEDEVADYCSLGGGLATQLGAGSSFVRPISAYCPRRQGKIDLLNPDDAFIDGHLYCGSIFLVNQAEYDDNYCITSLDFARRMLDDSTLVSAYELKLRKGLDSERVKAAIPLDSESFVVKTRYEQQADNYRIMQIEKWITFLIVIFILLIASFNVIGALSMLIIDKEDEIMILRNIGASDKMIRNIFACEGMLVSGIGAVSGIVIGVILCLLQERYGFITLGSDSSAYIVSSYPVELHWLDVLCAALAVFVIGIITTIYPLSVLNKRKIEN